MPQFENTTLQDLTAAGFTKVVDYGRIELFSGRLPNGDSTMKLFDSGTGRAIEIGGETLSPMETKAIMVGFAVMLITLMNRAELNLPAGFKNTATTTILALFERP